VGKRAPGQKLLTVPTKEQFLKEVDAGLISLGRSNRAQFVREAIREKLQSLNIHVPEHLTAAPGRAPSIKYHERSTKETNSGVGAKAERARIKGISHSLRRVSKSSS
jgi:metal-responsive CopG/Arc/MetJ family transcriptional regulator